MNLLITAIVSMICGEKTKDDVKKCSEFGIVQ